MGAGDKRKQSLYFPEEMLEEIQAEAQRQDRSLSWIVQQAWKLSRSDISRLPTYSPLSDPPGSEAAQYIRGKFDQKP